MSTVPTPLIENLQRTQQMLLMMGEMTQQEIFISQSVVAETLQKLEDRGYGLFPIQPTEGLIMSMAIRFDHGLGLEGYYDFEGFDFGGFVVGGHAKHLDEVRSKMKAVHQAVTDSAQRNIPEILITTIQDEVKTDGLTEDEALTAKAAVRYALTQLQNQGYVIAPHVLTAELSHAMERGYSKVGEFDPQHINPTSRQLYEEVVGEGFYRPEKEAQYQGSSFTSRIKI